MTIVRRVVADKRVLVSIVAIAAAVDVGLYALAVYPWQVRVANARERAAAADTRLQAEERSYAVALATMNGKDQADEELRTFYREVLPTDLAGARRITYPRLAALAAETSLRAERRSQEPDQERGSRLARLRTTMVLAGDYRNIRRFIHELETAPEFIVIEDVALAQTEGTDAGVELTLTVSTYYWAERDEG